MKYEIATVLGVPVFNNRHYTPKNNAQRNLSGKTHYVDQETLAAFHSRILSAGAIKEGLIFVIIESIPADYQISLTRVHRFVAFDLAGNIIEKKETTTKAKAEKLAKEWSASFDEMAYYKELLTQEATFFAKMAENRKELAAKM